MASRRDPLRRSATFAFTALVDRALPDQETAEASDVADLNHAEAAFRAVIESKPLDRPERYRLVQTTVDLLQHRAVNLRRLVGLACIDHDADRSRFRGIARKHCQ